MTTDARLNGKRILIVEDDWLIAKSLVRGLRSVGADVLGPVPTVHDAMDLVEAVSLDGAVLDINLRGEMAYLVVDLLIERKVPFVLTTGYDLDALPVRYRGIPSCTKPVEVGALAAALSL